MNDDALAKGYRNDIGKLFNAGKKIKKTTLRRNIIAILNYLSLII